TTVLLAFPLTVARADSPAATSQRAGVNLPRGAERKTEGDLPARFGHLLRSAGNEVKAPAGEDDAEVLVWTVKSGRARFTRSAVENALTEGGYYLADVSDAVRDTNPYDEEQYGLEHSDVALSVMDRRSYFTATNAAKQRTLLGIWLEGDERVVLALLPARYQPKAADVPLPDVSGPGVLLVKDVRDAMKGVGLQKTPAFAKLALKPRTVRGMVRDAAGQPIAGAQIVVQSSAAGGFRTDSRARTNAQGIYEVPLPVGVAQVVNADCTVHYNGQSYLLPLYPVDGECDHFNGQDGHIENFTLRTYGAG